MGKGFGILGLRGQDIDILGGYVPLEDIFRYYRVLQEEILAGLGGQKAHDIAFCMLVA